MVVVVAAPQARADRTACFYMLSHCALTVLPQTYFWKVTEETAYQLPGAPPRPPAEAAAQVRPLCLEDGPLVWRGKLLCIWGGRHDAGAHGMHAVHCQLTHMLAMLCCAGPRAGVGCCGAGVGCAEMERGALSLGSLACLFVKLPCCLWAHSKPLEQEGHQHGCSLPACAVLQGVDAVFKPVVAELSRRNL